METRRTTNPKIAGSTPARLVFLYEELDNIGRVAEQNQKQCTSSLIPIMLYYIILSSINLLSTLSMYFSYSYYILIIFLCIFSIILKNQKGRLPDVPICVNIMVLNRL